MDPAGGTITFQQVKMGPFTANGYPGLYATPSARATLPAPAGLPVFTIPAGNEVIWGYEGLVLTAQDTTLLGGIPFGAVDLTLLGFDQNFNPVAASQDEALTLAIDSTLLTFNQVGTITAWTAPGVAAPQTGYGDCPAYDVGPSGFIEVPVTVQDTNGFLCQYELEAQFGHDHAPVVTPPGLRGYTTNPTPAFPPDSGRRQLAGRDRDDDLPRQHAGHPGRLLLRIPALLRQAGNQWRLLARVYHLAEGDFQTISLKFSS